VKSAKPGKAASAVQVQHISAHGFWLFVEATVREYFLPLSAFPWFKQATIAEILTVKIERNHILHWPKLDVDLDLCQLEDPKRYPEVSRNSRQRLMRPLDGRSSAVHRRGSGKGRQDGSRAAHIPVFAMGAESCENRAAMSFGTSRGAPA
jgi:hypothetical protein